MFIFGWNFELRSCQRISKLYVAVEPQIVSDSMWPRGLQHAIFLCPPLSSRVSNSCPLNWWCCLTISSSTAPFYFCLQSFPAPGSFPMRQLFASGGQSSGASGSASVLDRNWYFSWQFWFQLFDSSSLALHMMYSAQKLKKQSDNTQPWCSPFPSWKQSIFSRPVLSIAS